MYKFHRIIIEGHTYCNRSCEFCLVPYMGGNDIKKTKKMQEDTLIKTLDEIKKNINMFKQPLKFSLFRYNEPLMFPSLLLRQSELIKEVFPDSYIYIHSNGDVGIDDKHMKFLKHIDEIYINDYDNIGLMEVLSLIEKNLPDSNIIKIEDLNGRHAVRISNNGKLFNYYVNSSKDIKLTTRGSVLQNKCSGRWINDARERDYPCNMKDKIFVVECNGDVMACCEVSNRIKLHNSELNVGNINNGIESLDYSKVDEFSLESCKYCHSSTEVCGL